MSKLVILLTPLFALTLTVVAGAEERVLFEDKFDKALSDRWEPVGLEEGKDYRIKDGALEMRIQSGKWSIDSPMLRVTVPFSTHASVIASVDVTILNELTEEGERAGLCLTPDGLPDFFVRKERIDGRLVFAPGNLPSQDQADVTEPVEDNTMRYDDATDAAGPLRILVDNNYAFFQVGPSKDNHAKRRYRNYFFSAVRITPRRAGFALLAVGAPKDAEHWVRFDNFRVFKL